MKKRHLLMLYCFLGFILFYGFFWKLGSYPLLDVDETRYVNMAHEMFRTRDYLTLYLNGEYFFEKPPLYFWIECLSFWLFGFVNELTARLPLVLLSLLPAGLLFFLCKKTKGDKFAIITISTLFTCLEYIFMTKLAILDSILTSFTVSSVLCYFYTFYVEEKNKKYFWALTYIFSGFAVLAKGIPGMAIPLLVILISSIVFRTYKETVKYLWGIILFLFITLPWHLIMLKMYGKLFFDEYVIMHHILRFFGSDIIGKNQPWYFYFLVLLWGLFPHIFILLSQVTKFKSLILKNKFITLNFVAIISCLLFFSLSGAKLITYILPVYPFFAVLIGEIWLNYINRGDKCVHFSLIIFNSFITISVIFLLFSQFILPSVIYVPFEKIKVVSLCLLIPYLIFGWDFLIRKRKLKLFLSIVILMSLISGFLTPYIYKFDYSFGQNDLMKFAKFAKENNYTISTYLTGKKYSLLYYGDRNHVEFQTQENIKWLDEELNKINNIVIGVNKDIMKLPVKVKVKGVKYSIIERLDNEKQ